MKLIWSVLICYRLFELRREVEYLHWKIRIINKVRYYFWLHILNHLDLICSNFHRVLYIKYNITQRCGKRKTPIKFDKVCENSSFPIQKVAVAVWPKLTYIFCALFPWSNFFFIASLFNLSRRNFRVRVFRAYGAHRRMHLKNPGFSQTTHTQTQVYEIL